MKLSGAKEQFCVVYSLDCVSTGDELVVAAVVDWCMYRSCFENQSLPFSVADS